ncbi:hypothetical protein [Methanobrevibacter sp.]|uniref:hypothetical protein n=1 Tax=Methanobrevibacter sp. TaxID=66852 RepID=UPI00388E3221
MSCTTVSSAFMSVSCAIISAVALLSAAVIQDKLIKANKIIVAIIILCLIKISSYMYKMYVYDYIF